MNTHRPLYDALERAVSRGDHVDTDHVDQHVARLYLHDFEQSGIHLDGTSRERVVQLTDHALQVCVRARVCGGEGAGRLDVVVMWLRG